MPSSARTGCAGCAGRPSSSACSSCSAARCAAAPVSVSLGQGWARVPRPGWPAARRIHWPPAGHPGLVEVVRCEPVRTRDSLHRAAGRTAAGSAGPNGLAAGLHVSTTAPLFPTRDYFVVESDAFLPAACPPTATCPSRCPPLSSALSALADVPPPPFPRCSSLSLAPHRALGLSGLSCTAPARAPA